MLLEFTPDELLPVSIGRARPQSMTCTSSLEGARMSDDLRWAAASALSGQRC